jgi:twitching motility protein PilT
LNLDQWLGQAIQRGASDVHLLAGYPPMMRLHGVLLEIESAVLTAEMLQVQLHAICPDPKRETLAQQRSCDFSHELQVEGAERRLRANLYFADGSLAAAFRVIPAQIPNWQWAGISPALGQKLVFQKDGLVIITGATGAGKSTTLAMLTHLLNEAGGYRIITIEEPIEYRFPKNGHSIISQREVGVDVVSFAEGLRSGLRQDPDVIVVGEVRDTETAQMALSAAETGHLVLATMHTRDTKGAISRYADFFPLETQRDMRNQFALSLRAIVSQRLLPGQIEGEKRVLALEVLWNTSPIFSAIRNNKLESIDNYLLTGRDEGMISFDESIRQLYRDGKISREIAEAQVRDRAFLTR